MGGATDRADRLGASRAAAEGGVSASAVFAPPVQGFRRSEGFRRSGFAVSGSGAGCVGLCIGV